MNDRDTNRNPSDTPAGVLPAGARAIRVESVSYLNAKPLIYGLDESADLELRLAVPSQLLEGLRAERTDVALLPVIDYQRLEGLSIVPAGGIGCDGPTLTVRIFSSKPIDQIRTLACDTDSHTSVALARVVLAERYGQRPEFVDLIRTGGVLGGKPYGPPVDAKLLIGDKVVCEEPVGYDHQLDLGHAWKEMTGLPFVFAVWTARHGIDLRDLPSRLQTAKQQGLAHVPQIIRRHALARGWPAGMALQYLTLYLKFDIGPRQLDAIRRFHALAHRHGCLPHPPRDLELYPE